MPETDNASGGTPGPNLGVTVEDILGRSAGAAPLAPGTTQVLPGTTPLAAPGTVPVAGMPVPVPLDAATQAYLAANAGGADQDGDLLADHFEPRFGLDPADPDTDGDGITDGYELLVLGTDALRSDTDFDSVTDDIEIAFGTDPLVADQLRTVPLEIPAEDLVDSDGDGIGDLGEEQAGTDPFNPDSDHDGALDSAELFRGSDPLDPASVSSFDILASGDADAESLDLAGTSPADAAFGTSLLDG